MCNKIQGVRKNMNDFNRGPRRNFGSKEMHKTTCSECQNECEVPFKPSGDRPVFCRDCFAKKRNSNF